MFIAIFPSGPLETNAILVGCPLTKRAACIDPAMGSKPLLQKKAQEEGFSIEKILLTHSHWDHFFDAAALKKETKALLFAHAKDRKNLEEPGSDRLPLMMGSLERVSVDREIKEGDLVEVGQIVFSVIHLPGHSPGGVGYYSKKEKVLFSGDTLFKGSFGRLSLPTAEPEKMWESLKKLSKLPPDTRVIPGHGEETTIGEEDWMENAREFFQY